MGFQNELTQTVEYFYMSKFTPVELLPIKILSEPDNSEIILENSGETEGLHCNRDYVTTQFLSFGDDSPRRKGTKEVYGSLNYLPGFMELDLETRSQISQFRFLIALL